MNEKLFHIKLREEEGERVYRLPAVIAEYLIDKDLAVLVGECMCMFHPLDIVHQCDEVSRDMYKGMKNGTKVWRTLDA